MGADFSIECFQFACALFVCKRRKDSRSLAQLVGKGVEVSGGTCTIWFFYGLGMLTPCQLSDMQEKQHALYIFNLLKNLIKPPSDGPPLRLPSFASLILSHALRGVFYPSNFIYPRTARFLLQRPELMCQCYMAYFMVVRMIGRK